MIRVVDELVGQQRGHGVKVVAHAWELVEENRVVGKVVNMALFCGQVQRVWRPCKLKGLLRDACRVQALYYRAHVIIYNCFIVRLRSSHCQQCAPA